MNRFPAALLAAIFALPAVALAQTFPFKPIRIIVPYAPNGLPDLTQPGSAGIGS